MTDGQHVMIDTETLGVSADAAILSFAAVRFDPLGDVKVERGHFGEPVLAQEHLYRVLNVDSAIQRGFRVEADTLRFWMKAEDEARRELADQPRWPPEHALSHLQKFCEEIRRRTGKDSWAPYVWARGPAFDVAKLEAHYKAFGEHGPPWHFRNVRCVRTVADIAHDLAERPEPIDGAPLHHPLWDCVRQIQTVQGAMKAMAAADPKLTVDGSG